MSLLDGDIAGVFSAAFGVFYLDATLYRKTLVPDGMGGGTSALTSEAVKVQPDQTTQAMRAAPGYVETDKRYLMLASGVAEPNDDCELDAEGHRWHIVDWSRDSAGAYFDLHVRRKA